MKKTITYFAISLFLLLFITVCASYYFVGTNSGLRKTLSLVNKYSGYEVHATEISGDLLTKTELKNVVVKGKLLDLKSEKIVLDWKSKNLLSRSLDIESIEIHHSQLTVRPSDKEIDTASKPFSLSDISIPISLNLKSVLITDMSLINPLTETSDFAIERFALGVNYVGHTANINVLEFQGQGIDIDLVGQIETRGDYPLALTTRTDYIFDTYGKESVQAKITGALKKSVEFFFTGKGLGQFTIDGFASNLFDEMNFEADLSLQAIDNESLNMPETQARANMQFKGTYGKQLDVVTTGQIDYQSPATDAVRLDIESHFDGAQLDVSQLHVDFLKLKQQIIAKGQYQLADKTIAAHIYSDTLGGRAEIHAQGSIAPVDVTGVITTKNLKPQTIYPHLAGDIDSQIQVSAQEKDGSYLVTAMIDTLRGMLQGKPVSGSGKVVFDQAANYLDVHKLAIDVAGNRANADGRLSLNSEDGQSDLIASIDAKTLEQLLPDLRGSIVADIVAKGTLEAPEITADISARNVAFQQQRVGSLVGKADISLASDNVLVGIDAKNITAGSTVVQSARVDINGNITNHQLHVDVKAPEQSLSLVGKGQFDSDSLRWSGILNTVNVADKIFGQWTLPKAATLALSADEVNIQSFCLNQKSASVCANGALIQRRGEFDIAVNNVATKPFASMMPDSVQVDTTISGTAKVLFADATPMVTGQFKTHGGQLRLATNTGSVVSKINRSETDIVLKNNQLVSKVNGDVQHLGRMTVDFGMPNISQSAIRAKITIANENIGFIQKLVPQLSDVGGKIDGNMSISGNPNKSLAIAGKVSLVDAQFNVPQYGTQVRRMDVDIFAKNGSRLGFKGHADAGKGRITIRGELNPAIRQGHIDIAGNNFQATNSRKLKLALSPDMHILFADHIKIRGVLGIPSALIVPESSGSKITVSEDVILPKSKRKKKSARSPVDTEITVQLGDDVRIASADIETRLSGQIKVLAKPGKAPIANGTISVQTGALRVYGQELTIERGRVIFSNGPITNPALDIRASREIDDDDVTVGVNVLGSARRPDLSLFSTPGMADSSILSYLLFGRAPNSESFGATALLQTGGLVGANTIARDIRSSIGLDVLDFSLTGFEAGKNISKKMYAGIRSSFFESLNEFLFKYNISGRTHIDAVISGAGGVSADIIKEIETD